MLACALVEAGRYDEAIDVFDKSFAGQERPFLFDQDFGYYNYRIQAHIIRANQLRSENDEGQAGILLERAIDYCREVLAERPIADTYRLLGAALSHSGRFDEAVQAYTRSIELQVDNKVVAEIYGDLAWCLKKMGRSQEAAEAERKAGP